MQISDFEQDKNNIGQLFLENENNIQVLTDTANKFLLSNSESQLVIKICEKLHRLYDQKETDNNKIKSIITQEQIWRNKLTPTEVKDKKEEIEKYQLNDKFYNLLPSSIKPDYQQYLVNISQVSMIMVKASHFVYQDSIARLKSNVNKDKMEVDEEKVVDKSLELFNQFNEILDKAVKDLPAHLSLDIIKYLKEKDLPLICVRLCQSLAKKNPVDDVLYQIIEQCVNSIFETISKIERKVKENGHLVTLQELDDLATLKKGEVLKEFIEYLIPQHLKDPYTIVKFGQKLLGYEQYNHVVLLTELGRIRLQHLEREQKEAADKLKEIEKLRADIESVKKVKGDLTQLQAKLLQLELEYDNGYKLLPNYYKIDKRELGKLNLDISTLRIKSILEMKQASKGTLNIQSHLDDTLATLLDPQHIYQLAILLKNTEVDTALVYGHRCQVFINDLEILREKRLPLQTQLDGLLAEEASLRKNGHSLSADVTALIAKLTADLTSLPAFPFFSTLTNRYEYNRLNLQVAQLMISCILSKKSNVSIKDQAQKDLLNSKVNELVSVCLEKFKDPKYLLELQIYLKDQKEDKILIQIANQVLNRCVEIENLRVKVKQLNSKIANSKDEAQSKQLQQELSALPEFPYYSSLESENQYDQTIYDSVDSLLHSLLDHFSFVEEKIRKAKMFNSKSIEEENMVKERDDVNALIGQSLSYCLPFIKSPVFVNKLASSVSGKRDSLFLDIQNYLHPILVCKNKESIQYKNMEITIQVLNQELSELTKFKKEMPESDIQILESTKSSIQNISIPYISEYLDAHSLHSKLIVEGINLYYGSLKRLLAPDYPNKSEVTSLIKINSTHIEKEFELLSKYIEDPDTFVLIINLLKERKEYKLISDVGKLAFDKLKIYRSYQKDQKVLNGKKNSLEEEREQLNKQRRRLSKEKNESLRDAIIKERVALLDPPFYSKEVDDLALFVGNLLVECNVKEKLEFETKASSKEMESQFQFIQTERKRIGDLTAASISMILENINSLEKLIKFANDLFNKKEYNLVLRVGSSIEDILEKKKEVIEEKESLIKQSKELQSQFLQSKSQKERDSIQILIDNNQKELEKVVPSHTYEQIKELTLKITAIMIESANFEDLGEVLRAQYIIQFKIDVSPATWDIIRNLSSEEEWAVTKNELVEYVMKKEENINSKIELLMKDGLFVQCIKIFPHPSTEEAELDIQLNLLMSLYEAIDQYQFNLLNEVIPIVQRYCKRCYQDWRADKLESLYDLVQKRFPSEIRNIFEVATDMLLVNILQSQYPIFLGMLKSFKKRMVNTLGLDSLWNSYLDNFKKTHKSKKRLIQMISFIGDSVWNIESSNKPPSKRSTPASGSTTQGNLKRIKVNLAPKKDESVDEEFYEDTDEESEQQ